MIILLVHSKVCQPFISDAKQQKETKEVNKICQIKLQIREPEKWLNCNTLTKISNLKI